MLQKYERVLANENYFLCQNVTVEELNLNRYIIMLSADGAAHEVSQYGDANVISVNLLMVNQRLLASGIKSTQSY